MRFFPSLNSSYDFIFSCLETMAMPWLFTLGYPGYFRQAGRYFLGHQHESRLNLAFARR